ncbi:YbaB/EbfC family nucleoid-associated protein [Solihabitans fulvus]|uniref:YbaB/EbfC family nucleoid-associated protein n=1 Tax=Solihabitans fulvus TaxID=1892852 RepID=UPI001CB76701|nr:YbaB/EbfC family nucleoid-associated protein [Solihabitans fulvus]
MPTDHQAQVDELLADYRRGREQLAAVQRTLASITASATSADGLVTATVGAQGTLTGLVLHETAYQRHRPAELAELVVRTTAVAAATAAERANQVIGAVLPADADPAAVLGGRADLRPEEIGQQPVAAVARRAEAVAEENFEEVESWLHQGGRRDR